MSAIATMESPPILAPSKPIGTGLTQSDHHNLNPSHSSLRSKASKQRLTTSKIQNANDGGISDPEEYSSMVAAAVANIVSSSGGKSDSEDYSLNSSKDYKHFYDLDLDDVIGLKNDHIKDSKGNLSTLDLDFDFDTIDNITSTTTKKIKGTGKQNNGNVIGNTTSSTGKTKKSKSKIIRTKSKTKTTTSNTRIALRKSATVKAPSQQESYGSLAISLQNAVSHSGTPKVPAPTLLPRNPNVMDLHLYLNRIQQYFNHLGYHRQGEPKIRILTNMSMKHHVDTSRSLIKAGEPIKCLHALVLAIHFTNCSNHVERFPINFKSEFNGKEYKHVVLGVYLYGMFGALGISRDPGLQDKPVTYPRLYDLISDYNTCYSESSHILHEVKIGGVITHDPHSVEPINWKVGSTVQIEGNSAAVIEATLEKISKQLRSKMGSTCLRNVRPTQMVFPTMSTDQPQTPQTQTNVISTPSTLRPILTHAKKSKTSGASGTVITPTNVASKVKSVKK